MTTQKRFAVFDSDSHVVEPREVWEKYLEPEYRVLGKHALWREEGTTNSYLKVNGEMFRDTMNSNIPRHAIWRPGMTWDDVGDLDPHTRHAMNDGASDPQARLRDMDAMGVDQALLYPTWFAEGFHLVKDPDVAYALARAYNNWIADFCAAAPDRLFAAAMLPLQNMDFTAGGVAASGKHPVLPRRLYSAHVYRGPLLYPSVLRPAVGGAGAPGRHRCRPPDAGPVEPGVDLARPVFRKNKRPARSSPASLAAAPAPSLAAAMARRARPSLPRQRRWDIRWRRSCPTGWTITCSWPPR